MTSCPRRTIQTTTVATLTALFLILSSALAIPNQPGTTDPDKILARIQAKESAEQSVDSIFNDLRIEMRANEARYFFLDQYGWVDGRHFFWTAGNTRRFGRWPALLIGFLAECYQFLRGQPSGFSPEDLTSNSAGAAFAVFHQDSDLKLASALARWFRQKGARAKDDPEAHFEDLPLNP